jgi:hypothetical protein
MAKRHFDSYDLAPGGPRRWGVLKFTIYIHLVPKMLDINLKKTNLEEVDNFKLLTEEEPYNKLQ